MKKMSAIVLFFCCNALFIFFEVHKQGLYLKLSYEIQKLQTELCVLKKQQNDLIYALHTYQQPHVIQAVAEQKLGMLPIQLKKIISLHQNITTQEINKPEIIS